MKLLGSLLRHTWAVLRGDDFDQESGRLHMAHAALDALYLVTYQLQKLGTDDRPSKKEEK
jgi:hypothetical protein